MPDQPTGPVTPALELVAECREAMLATLDETSRSIRLSDAAWLAQMRKAAGERFDELIGIRDRRGFEMARSLTASRISLIHEEDLDFSIELTELSRHLHEALGPELVRLSQRIGLLLKQGETLPEQLPVGPETACEGLRALAMAAQLAADARLRLLERIRQPLEEHLRALYVRLNRRLDEAGLPVWSTATQRPPERAQQPGAGAAQHAADGRGAITPLGRLQQALRERLPPRSGDGAAALERLEACLKAARPGGSTSATPGLRELLPLLPPRKACALEALEQLFATVAADTGLPQIIRTLIGRMHTPLLRQALNNDRLLEDPDSMALALLERIAAIGYFMPAGTSANDSTLQALAAIVARLADAGSADEIACSQALAAVDAIGAGQSARTLAASQRHHEMVGRAERKEVALLAASRAIRALTQTDTHAAVRQVLETYWVHLLAQSASHHGVHDPAWRERLETANQLIRSVPPHPGTQARQEVMRILPGLISQLRKGLAELGIDEQKTNLVLTPCMNLHSAIIAGRPAPEFSWKSPHRPATLSGSRDAGGLMILQHGGHPADEPRPPPALQKLAAGDTVRAILPGEIPFDGTMTWRSPRGHMLLLSDPRSGASLALSLRAVAELAAAGKLEIGRPTLAERTASRGLAEIAKSQ